MPIIPKNLVWEIKLSNDSRNKMSRNELEIQCKVDISEQFRRATSVTVVKFVQLRAPFDRQRHLDSSGFIYLKLTRNYVEHFVLISFHSAVFSNVCFK